MKLMTPTIGILDTLRDAVRDSEFSLNRLSKESGVDRQQLRRFMRHGGGLGADKIDRLLSTMGLRIDLARKIDSDDS